MTLRCMPLSTEMHELYVWLLYVWDVSYVWDVWDVL